MTTNLRTTLPAFVLLGAVACGGSKAGDVEKPHAAAGQDGPDTATAARAQAAPRLPEVPSLPAPLPSSVLAALSIGDPQGQLAGLAAYADAVQPGFGAMVSPSQLIQGAAAAVGAPGLDGIDLGKPIHLLLLDPRKGGGQALLVVAVADQQKVAGTVGGEAVVQFHGGYAAIGTAPAIQAASPYALSNVARTAPPRNPHAVIYMNRIMESYGTQVSAQLRQAMGVNPTAADKKVAEGVLEVLAAVERMEADLEASGQVANASLAVFPQQGSALAEWAGLQKPSDYSVAARLPAGDWLMVAAGRIDYGPLRGFLTDMAAAEGKPEMAEWIGVFGQEVAFALFAKDDRTVRASGLVAVTDTKKLGQLIGAYVKKMAARPTPMDSMEVTARPSAHRTGGATLHAITVKPGAQTPPEEKKEFEKAFGQAGMKSYFGVAGNWMVFSLGKDPAAKALASGLVKGSRSQRQQSSLSPTFERMLADSKTRNESGVLGFDLSVVAPEPAKAKGAEVTVGVGFEGPVMRSRVTVPPATLRFVMQMRGAGMAPATP